MSEHARNVFLLTFARRGEREAIKQAMAVLQERHPGARLVAIGTPVSEPVLRELGVEHLLLYSPEHPARRVIEEARLCMPEAAAVVYEGRRFSGHLKLEALVLLVGAREVLRCRLDAEPVRVGRLRLAAIVAGKAVAMVGRFLVGAAVVALACGVLCWSRYVEGEHRAGRT